MRLFYDTVVLEKLFKQLNGGRQDRLREELQVLRRLPGRRVDDSQKARVRVGPSRHHPGQEEYVWPAAGS